VVLSYVNGTCWLHIVPILNGVRIDLIALSVLFLLLTRFNIEFLTTIFSTLHELVTETTNGGVGDQRQTGLVFTAASVVGGKGLQQAAIEVFAGEIAEGLPTFLQIFFEGEVVGGCKTVVSVCLETALSL
jgi:hypothetical protein